MRLPMTASTFGCGSRTRGLIAPLRSSLQIWPPPSTFALRVSRAVPAASYLRLYSRRTSTQVSGSSCCATSAARLPLVIGSTPKILPTTRIRSATTTRERVGYFVGGRRNSASISPSLRFCSRRRSFTPNTANGRKNHITSTAMQSRTSTTPRPPSASNLYSPANPSATTIFGVVDPE